MEAAATTNASVDLMIKELLDMVDGEEMFAPRHKSTVKKVVVVQNKHASGLP